MWTMLQGYSELRMICTFLNNWKKSKEEECSVTYENYIKFQISVSIIIVLLGYSLSSLVMCCLGLLFALNGRVE